MRKIFKINYQNWIFPMIFTLIWAIICWQNYLPGTYLSGWDTLHPEFNFSLNFERLIWGVFRSNQGLGAVAAHAHMADLPRVIILFFMSFILPNSFLRFAFIALNLLIGVLGVYWFLKKIIFKDEFQIGQFLAFLGSLFYLFNLGTLQQFIVPFEMFTVQYAALPWLFLTASIYLTDPNRKNLLLFSLVTLLAAPMAYAATLWYSYFLIFSIYLLFFFKKSKKAVLILLGTTLIINSFWLLPNFYSLLSGQAALIPEAKINKAFSEEAFLHNQNHGHILDTLIFKNFLFDWLVYQNNDQFGYLLSVWHTHLNNFWVLIIGYLGAFLVLLGIIKSFFSKNSFAKALIIPTCLAFIVILNATFPISIIFENLQNYFPLFKEALRFPYTKFSIPLIFFFSCLFAIGIFSIQIFLKKFLPEKKFKFLLFLQTVLISFALIIFCWPYLTGNLISRYVQVKIPSEYFELFRYFDQQDSDKRIANLPIHSFWGWIYYNWGFQGAQFISFGLKQPLLDRDYDRWNKGNENYYQEMSYAIYSQNQDLLNKILDKYQISFLILDKNVIIPGNNTDKQSLFFPETESLLQSNPKIHLVKTFNKIQVFQVDLDSKNNHYVNLPNTLTEISPQTNITPIDWPYFLYGDYTTSDKDLSLFNLSLHYFPFLSLADNQNYLDQALIKLKGNRLEINTNLSSTVTLSPKNFLEQELSFPAEIYIRKDQTNLAIKIIPLLFTINNQPQIKNLFYSIPLSSSTKDINNWLLNIDNYQTLMMRNISKTDFSYQGTIFLQNKFFNNLSFYPINQVAILKDFPQQEVSLCSTPSQDQLIGSSVDKNSLTITAKNAQACFRINLDNLITPDQLSDYKSLIEISFDIYSSTDTLGNYCLFDQRLNRCVKEQKYLRNGQKLLDFFISSPNDLSYLKLIFFLDGVHNQQEEIINYQNLAIAVFQPALFLSIPPDDIAKAFTDEKVILDKNSTLTLDYATDKLTSQFNLFESGHQSSSCSTILPKNFTRKTIDNQYIEYSSLNGSSCDYFSFPNLPHNLAYIISLKSQNLAGLPLRLCVANPLTKRCDLYSVLPKNKEVSSQLLLIPPASDGGIGYNIHLDNYSVGEITTINRVYEMKILPFPYNWLSKMEFTTANSIQLVNQGITLKSVQEIFPSFFIINLSSSKINQPKIITFNQSYDSGWQILGREHLKINNWANGWIVPFNQEQIILIYWPQLLEFIGFFSIMIFWILTWKKKFV